MLYVLTANLLDKILDYVLFIGAKRREPGMERSDLLKDNGKIFVNTNKAINDNTKSS